MKNVKRPRRKFLRLAAGAAALPAVSRFAWAQAYPARPVRWVVAGPVGGGGDIVTRLLAQWLSERVGQAFIVDNLPGGGNNIGTDAVVRAPADGYTLLLATTGNAINTTLYDKLSFNFIRDIAPVVAIARVPWVVTVAPSFPAKTVPEFIAHAKTSPNKVKASSVGNGTTQHVSIELFKMMTGIDIIHVPYRGAVPALNGLLNGEVQVMFPSVAFAIEHVRSGKLRPLAVTTATRSEALPDLPTVTDFVADYEASDWYGVGIPKDTPTDIVNKLNNEFNAALADPKMKMRLAELGLTMLGGSPTEFGKLIAGETEKWGKVIRAANIKPE
jgi:tripartite-type tricarboxylate transporter receptor subunit TctC